MNSTTANKNEATNVTDESDLPEGRYRLVSWDTESTGMRLIDEIFHIAAYTPDSQFDQYILPHAGLNAYLQRRFNVRVWNGRFNRDLVDRKSNIFLDTKVEFTALKAFLTWLENIRGDRTDGVILVFHGVGTGPQTLLLESMRRCNLLDRFAAVVKGLANSFLLAESKYAGVIKCYSLKSLARTVLGMERTVKNGADRARVCYLLVQYLLRRSGAGDVGDVERRAIELVQQCGHTVAVQLEKLNELRNMLERHRSFNPVFKRVIMDAKYAKYLQRCLAENNFDFAMVKKVWEESRSRDGLHQYLRMMWSVNRKERDYLVDILYCHFSSSKPFVMPDPNRPPSPIYPLRREQPVLPYFPKVWEDIPSSTDLSSSD